MRVGATLDQLRTAYPNDVRIAFKQHPLPMHSQAMIAAEAAMAAAAQGKFAEMHAKLLENSRALSREKILEIATGLGLDVARLTKELDARTYKTGIDGTMAEAQKIGISGTPSFLVNGRFLVGAQPLESFKRLVDEELAKAKGGAPAEVKPANP